MKKQNNKKSKKIFFSLALLLGVSCFVYSQPASVLKWDPTGSSTSFNTAGNWYDAITGTVSTSAPTSGQSYLMFGVSPGVPGGTVTLDTNFTLAPYLTGPIYNSIQISPSNSSFTFPATSSSFGVNANASISFAAAATGSVNSINVPIVFSGTASPSLSITGASGTNTQTGLSGDVLSGNISGPGSLVLNGMLVISGSNTYSGNTTIAGPITLLNYAFPTTGLFYATGGNLNISQLPSSQSQVLNLDPVSGSYTSTFTVLTGSNAVVLDPQFSGTYTSVNFGSNINLTTGTYAAGKPGGTFTCQCTGGTKGTITISGANSYSQLKNIGSTNITDGITVALSSPTGFGAYSNVSIIGPSTLNISSGLGAPIQFNTLSGTGSLVVAGSTPVSGSFSISSGSAGSFTGSVSGTYSSGLGLTYSGGSAYSFPSIAPFGSFTLNGGAVFSVLSNPSSIAMSLNIFAGSVAGSGGGIFKIASGASAIPMTGSVTVQAQGGIDTNGNTVTVSGVVSQTGSGFNFIHQDSVGTGSLIIQNASQTLYSVQNNSGELIFSGISSNPFQNSAATGIVVNGGTVDISRIANWASGSFLGYLYSTGTAAGTLDMLGSGTPSLTSLPIYTGNKQIGTGTSTTYTSFGGIFKGSSSQSIQILNGMLTLTNPAVFNNFAGTLSIGQSGVPGITTPSLGSLSNITFESTGASLILTGTSSYSGTINLNPTPPTASIIDNISVATGYTLTLSGPMIAGTSAGGYGVTLNIGSNTTTSYTGTLVLSGSNQFNNITSLSVQSGTLQANSSNALNGISSVDLWSEAALNCGTVSLTLSQVTGMYSYTGTTPASSIMVTSPGTLTINKGSSAFPFYGCISGSGNIVLSGSGTSPTFIGNNTYTGSTTIQNGVTFNTTSLGSTSSYVFSGGSTGGGILTIGGSSSYAGAITVAGSTPATFATNTYNATLSGTITVPSTASFTKIGVGILSLSGTNNIQGTLNIYGGTLSVSPASLSGTPSEILFAKFNGTLAPTGAITIASATTITLGTTATFDTTNGNIIINGPVVYWDDPVDIGEIGGSYTGGLIVTGGGTVTLAGSPVAPPLVPTDPAPAGTAYNGVTTIQSGTLISNSQSLPSLVLNPGTLLSANIPKTLLFNCGTSSATFKPSTNFTSFPTIVFLSSGTMDTGTFSITANNVVAGQNSGTSSYVFTKEGTGSLILSGNNIYSIKTQINTGTLKTGTASVFSGTVQTSGALGIGSAVTIDSSGILDLNGFNNTIGGFSGSGILTDSSGGTKGVLTITQGGTFSGTVSGSPSITFNATSGQTLTLGGSSVAIGALENNGSGSLQITQPISATSFTAVSTSTVDLSLMGFPTYPNPEIDLSGIATFAGSLKLPSTPPTTDVVLFQYSSYAGTFASVSPASASLRYNATQLVWQNSTPVGVNGIWTGSTSGLWITGTNWTSNPKVPGIGASSPEYDTATFPNISGTSSVTLSQTGTLAVMTVGDPNSSPTTAYTISGTGSIVFGNTVAQTPELKIYGTAGISHEIQLPIIAAYPLNIISGSNANLTLSGSVSFDSNALTFSGTNIASGSITVSGVLSGSGLISIDQGIVNLSPSTQNAIGSVSLQNATLGINSFALSTGSVFTISGTSTIQALSNLSLNGSNSLSNTGNLTLDANGYRFTAGSVISGSGSVICNGSVVFNNTNTFTGSLTVNSGTLTANYLNSFGSASSVVVNSGAQLVLGSVGQTATSISGNGSIAVGSPFIIASTSSFSGVISGSNNITFQNGTLTLSGTNTFSGSLNAGTNTIIKAGSTTAFGSSIINLGSGATLNLNNFNNSINGLTSVDSTGIVNLTGAVLTIGSSSFNGTFAGVIKGSGSVIYQNGAIQLLGSSVYTGSTTISGGTVTLGSSSSAGGGLGPLGNLTALTISYPGVLNLNGFNQTIGSLGGTGRLNLGSGSLTIDGSATQTFSGKITGSGSIQLSNGTMTLSGMNTFSGGVIIGGSATLTALGPNSLGLGSVTNNGSLNFSSSVTGIRELTNNGTLDLASYTGSVTSFVQNSTNSSLQLAVSGVTCGSIQSSGGLTLGGNLTVTGSSGNVLVLLSGSSRNGVFTTVNSSHPISYRIYQGSYEVYYNGVACSGVWTGDSLDNKWATSGNWQGGCIPGIGGGVDAEATFEDLASSIEQITLSDSASNPVLASVQFSAASTSYTLLGGTISFEAISLPNAQISVVQGSHIIRSNIQGNNSEETLYAQIDDGATFSFGSHVGDSDAVMSNLGQFTILEGTGTDTGLGVINNYGRIGDYTSPVNAITIQGLTVNNYFLMIAGDAKTSGTVSVQNVANVNNYYSILAHTLNVSSGSLNNSGDISTISLNQTNGQMVNSGLITTEQLNISGGQTVNSGAITTLPWVFAAGSVTNIGAITTSNLQMSSSATYTTQIQSKQRYGYIAAEQVSLAGSLIVEAMPELDYSNDQIFALIDVGSTYNSKFANISYLNFPIQVDPEVVYLPHVVQLNIKKFTPPFIPTPHALLSFLSVGQHNMLLLRKSEQLKDRMLLIPVAKKQKQTIETLEVSFVAQETEVLGRKQEILAGKAKEGKPGSFYIGPIGAKGRIQSYHDQPSISYGSAGFLTGADYGFDASSLMPVWVGVGTAIDYQYKNGTVHSHVGSFGTQKIHGTLYSVFVPQSLPSLDINFMLGYAYSWDAIHRNTGLKRNLKTTGSTQESIFDLVFDAEYKISQETWSILPRNLSFTPFGAIQYIHDNVGGYKEKGAGNYDLQYQSTTPQSACSLLGSRFNFEKTRGAVKGALEIDLGWQYEFMNLDQKIHFSTFNTIAYKGTSMSYGPGRNTALCSVDLLFKVFEKFTIEASCDTKWNADFVDAFFYFGLGGDF